MLARSSLLAVAATLLGAIACAVPAAEKEQPNGERRGETRTYEPGGQVEAPDWVPGGNLAQSESGKRALAQVDEVVNGPGGVTGCELPIPEVMNGFPLLPNAKPVAPGETISGEHFAQLKSPAPAPRTAPDATLELRLTAQALRTPTQPLELGLSMVNNTTKKLVVMRSLDGSVVHWRSPYYDLYLEEVSTGRQFRWEQQGGRCGNVNSIRAEDYVELAPGTPTEDVPGPWADYIHAATVGKPGTYRAWVVYQFCGFEEGGVPLGQDVHRNDVHAGIHVSNVVTFDVK